MKTFYKSMMKIDLFSYSLLKSPKMFRFKTKYVYSNVYSLEREKVYLQLLCYKFSYWRSLKV